MRRYIHLLVLLALSVKAPAAVKMVDPDPVPDASLISSDALQDAVRAGLASAAQFLVDQATTNQDHLVTHPYRRKQLVGYGRTETYEVRYKMVTRERPVYKYEYEEEEYEEFVVQGGTSTSSRKMKKVKRVRRKVVGKKQVGTQKYQVKVGDPNGDIVETHARHLDPIYEGAPDIWPRDFLGVNAMALYALLRCGISPTTDEVRKLAEAMFDHVDWYGIPDMTWDVAWLCAAYANLPEDAFPGESARKKFRKQRELLATKLLEGQVTDGPGRGLWGPVCINTKLLSAMIAYEDTLNKELVQREERLKKQPNVRSRKEKVAEAKQAIEDFIKEYRGVARQGLRLKQVTSSFAAAPNDWTPQLIVQGLPYDIYSQVVVDMESTSVALYAVRELNRHGFMPKKTIRPEALKGKSIAPPQIVSAILARSAAAVAAAQQKDGSWHEKNVHQPIKYFDPIGWPQLLPEKLFQLQSHANPMTSAQAYGVLTDAGAAVGLQKMLGRYGRNAAAGTERVRTQAEDYLVNKIGNTPPVGRNLSPFDYMFKLNRIHRSYGGPEEDRRDLWMRTAHRLLHLQDSDGAWGHLPIKKAAGSSGVWAWRFADQKHNHDVAQEKKAKKDRKPYQFKDYRDRRIPHRAHYTHHYRWLDSRIVSTVYAMLHLLEGVRPPVAAYLKEGPGDKAPLALTKTIQAMSKREKQDLTFLRITPQTSGRELRGMPLLVIDGSAKLISKDSQEALRYYLEHGGMVFVQVDPNKGTGLGQKLQAMLGGAKGKSVPADSEIFEGFRGQKPKLEGYYNSRGGLQVMLATMSDKNQLAGSIQVIYKLIQHRLPSDYFDLAFPAPMREDHAIERVNAMHRLDGTIEDALYKRAAKEARAKAIAEGKKPPPAPAKRPTQKDPDALPEPATMQEEELREDEQW